MPKMKNLTGMQFGRLSVVNHSGISPNGAHQWFCRCKCGGSTTTTTAMLTHGRSKSCGCLSAELSAERATKHGASKSGAYRSWAKMLARCNNKNSDKFVYYGGRGITVSDDWLSFENFYRDMGDRKEGMSIDRIDNNQGYCKENCRWATRAEQAKNKRSAVIIQHNGRSQCLADWSRDLGINRTTITSRLRRGVPIDGKTVWLEVA